MKLSFFCAISLFLISITAFSQHFTTPDSYIKFINAEHRAIAKEIVAYTATLEQGKSLKDEEHKRKAILLKLKKASIHIAGMPPYKNDKTMQDSLVAYARATHKIIHERYPKIQAIQDSASKFYESALKFSQAKKQALGLLINDEVKLNNSVKAFFTKYKVEYSTKNEEEYQNLLAIQSASNYHSTLHLNYLKVSAQEAIFTKVIAKKDKEEIEKQAGVLAKLSKEAKATLDTMKALKDEKDFINSTKNYFVFSQKESEKDAAVLIALIASETKPTTSPDSTVTAVAKPEFSSNNSPLLTYSTNLNSMSAERQVVINNWTKEQAGFLKRYFNQE